MQVEAGMVVRSVAGHDANLFFVVVSADGQYVCLADGKRRPLEKPKRKNNKHIRKTNSRLDLTSLDTNRKVRHALCACCDAEGGIEFV